MSHSHFQKRIRTLVGISFALFIILILRLIEVQAVSASAISARAANELLNTSVLLAPRGTITDANGIELARSVAAFTIVIDQTMITDPIKTAAITSPVLGMTPEELIPLYTGVKRYQIILKNAEPAVWRKLQTTLTDYNTSVLKERGGLAKRIVGFFSERSYVREYPTGKLASSLIGIINDAGVGASGIESSLNSKLAGVNGLYEYANGAGTIIPGSANVQVSAQAGTGVQLTINRDIQWVAQDAISQAVKSSHAKSGTVIVMDPKTGAILAQASAPNFDPADRATITLESLRNPAVQDVYEPGSTGKVITVAAGLEEKVVDPATVFTIPNTYKTGGRVFRDAENHPTERLTTAGILARSSNIGVIQIGAKMENQKFYDYLRKFGIGSNTGSGLPGESAGLLPSVATWSNTSAPTIAFGQGYSVTALQATSVMATIANGGVRVTPTVVAGTFDPSGHYSPAKSQLTTRVVSEDSAASVRTMLESVVSEHGTAPTAAIPGYRVAGKTGTANRVDPECGCYRGYTSSFIGYAPADAPRYVVSVVIQKP
ncbi:MAG: penicillin-binding protein 2, partial [Actinobacteria bacterium]|nr:penicillin-binding protein 2 [Actinomycetota bacterium]